MIFLLMCFLLYVSIGLFAVLYALDVKQFTDRQAVAFGIMWPVFLWDYVAGGVRQVQDKQKIAQFKPMPEPCQICEKDPARCKCYNHME